ncbi:hypothetical protein BDZ91DRAFT_43825 [Kalaharituber pfeilii]|nr:hypothetical protein BDZ91DRAFT_43825 [Kalaharituber pfeilii]
MSSTNKNEQVIARSEITDWYLATCASPPSEGDIGQSEHQHRQLQSHSTLYTIRLGERSHYDGGGVVAAEAVVPITHRHLRGLPRQETTHQESGRLSKSLKISRIRRRLILIDTHTNNTIIIQTPQQEQRNNRTNINLHAELSQNTSANTPNVCARKGRG